MKTIHALSLVACLLFPLSACCVAERVTPTMQPPEPTITSMVAYRLEKSMLHADIFRLTLTMVTHLSNAVMLTVEVENTSDQAVEWSPHDAVAEAYVQDEGGQFGVLSTEGIFDRETILGAGATETGWLIFPLPRGETFRFYYPASAPEYLTLESP